MHFRNKLVLLISTGFGVGKIPWAPGTFGSLLGLFLCALLAKLNIYLAGCLLVGFIIMAVRVSDRAAKLIKKEDPGCIVVDEIAGIMVTLIGFSFELRIAVVGFCLFRLLDIIKPPPIRTVEKRFTGGTGIVIDDVVAGLMAQGILRIIAVSTDFF